nr:ankyrin repeat-containing protein ITN1-like [Tanacetum cinerariifolium]
MVEQDEKVITRKIGSVTVLHLASRIGNAEIVSIILELRPEMVTAENNDNSETPLHEACRMGHEKVVRLIMMKNQWVAIKLNCDNQSPLFLACSYGHFQIVDFLLNHMRLLLGIIDDVACLHVAVSKGRTDIVKKLIEKCPDLANRKDINGSLPLHCACRKGQLEISKMLLGMDPDQALQFDKNGYTPLHVAAINGNLTILEEFASTVPISFQIQSKHRENLFHLTMRFNKLDAFKYVDGVLKGTDLFYQLDKFGNTIQHLAQIRGFPQFAEYMKEKQNTPSKNQPKREHLELHREALQNARNTVTLVNILIATVTFAAVLVSIIPFKRKPLTRILAAAHKVTWVALSFMAVSYVAATWVILPTPYENHRMNWVLEALLSICAGTLGVTFFGLGVMLMKHQLKKYKWRKGKSHSMIRNVHEAKLKNVHNLSLSTNSDDHLDAQEHKQHTSTLKSAIDFEDKILDAEVQENEAIPLSDEEIALDAASQGTVASGSGGGEPNFDCDLTNYGINE